jgi:hypothetical protein
MSTWDAMGRILGSRPWNGLPATEQRRHPRIQGVARWLALDNVGPSTTGRTSMRLLALALLLPLPALASSASASFENLVFETSPLAGNTGATWLTIDTGSSTAQAAVWDLATGALLSDVGVASGWPSPATGNAVSTDASSTAAVTPSMWSVSGSADGKAGFFAASSTIVQWGVLSPHTEITVTFDLDLAVAVDVVCGTVYCDSVSARGQIASKLTPTPIPGAPTRSGTTSIIQGWSLSKLSKTISVGSPNASSSTTQHGQFSFSNFSDAPQYFWFSPYVEVTGAGIAQTVPEPETYALMLAGLVAIGVVRSRARGSATPARPA